MITLHSKKPHSSKLMALLALFVWSASFSAHAKDYKVEAIVFENTVSHAAYESTHYKNIAETTSDALTWEIEPTMLVEEATAIETSKDYELLAHYSWGQRVLPSSDAAVFSVIDTRIQGWIKVYASHLLFANLDLDFNGYRLSEKRRLKLDEKHFFDHPKFGVLLQVSRLEADPEAVSEQAPAQRNND